MKHLFLTLALTLGLGSAVSAQTKPVTKDQLMPARDLATALQSNDKVKPLVFNVGPMENIKSAVAVGRGTSVTGIEKLKSSVMWEDKKRIVVVYCGCCSYASCPNIQPAYDALIKLGFKNAKILDLPVGIKEDWVQKGYPIE